MSFDILQLAPSDIDVHRTGLQEVYEGMFGVAPGEGGGFQDQLTVQSQFPGFRCVVAAEAGSEQLIGMAYGFTGEPGQSWRDDMAAAIGPAMTQAWLADHFEFAEFGVMPERHRRGIGTLMYRALFDGLPHPTAVLTVRIGNEPAHAFYRHHGWRDLYEGFVSRGGHGPYVIMGLPAREYPT